MSEMLGNQYFLSRNYSKAAAVFEKLFNQHQANKSIKKKLIICLTQTGEIQKAFNVFYELAKEDLDFIINTDPIADDCPCPELVKHYGSFYPYEDNSSDLKMLLGMLWLYCDLEKSLGFFTALNAEKNIDPKITEIFEILNSKKTKTINHN